MVVADLGNRLVVASFAAAFINFSIAVVIDVVSAFFRFGIVVACSGATFVCKTVAVVVFAVTADFKTCRYANFETYFIFIDIAVAVVIDSVADLRACCLTKSFDSAGDYDRNRDACSGSFKLVAFCFRKADDIAVAFPLGVVKLGIAAVCCDVNLDSRRICSFFKLDFSFARYH